MLARPHFDVGIDHAACALALTLLPRMAVKQLRSESQAQRSETQEKRAT